MLTSIPSPDPSWARFALGPLTIHTYALCIIAGIFAAVWITERRLRRRGVAPWTTIDVALWAVPLGIIAARLYHVFTHMGDYFHPGADPWAIFAIWDGGNAIYGSLIGGAVGIAIGCRRAGLRFWAFADALAPALFVAQSIGRLGNWFNQELFGLPTTLPWGLQISPSAPMFPDGMPPGTLFHPLFLYEIIWNLTGALLIVVLERRLTLGWGRSLGIYLAWYGLGRSGLEARIRGHVGQPNRRRILDERAEQAVSLREVADRGGDVVRDSDVDELFQCVARRSQHAHCPELGVDEIHGRLDDVAQNAGQIDLLHDGLARM